MRLLSRSLATQLGIDVDQHTVGGLSLAGMTCDRVAMIEVRMRRRIKLDYTVFWENSYARQDSNPQPFY